MTVKVGEWETWSELKSVFLIDTDLGSDTKTHAELCVVPKFNNFQN